MAFEDTAMVSTVTLEKTTFFSNGKCCASKCKEGKKEKERWSNESKRELVSYDSLPNFLKHNEFILEHYRSEWPLKQTILSIFSIHNETINIWTHLIGFFIFLSLTTCAVSILPLNFSSFTTNTTTSLVLDGNLGVFPSFSLPLNLTQPSQSSYNTDETPMVVARWPFYAYMFGAMFCLLMSSTCHLLSCHSEHTCYLMLRLDYAGISALIVTSFYPLVYYSFLCHPLIRNVYLSSITIFGAGAILVSLVPIFETPGFRYARAGLFACMGLSGLVPIVHKLIVFGDRPEAVATAGYEAVMGMFYALGVVVYALRVPERWMPGRFDLAGHSHQLFHVLVIAGAYTHYLAGLVYLSWREVEGC